MGLSIHEARFLFDAIKHGIALNKCLTLGRQNIFASQDELANIAEKMGVPISSDQWSKIFKPDDDRNIYAEGLLSVLGAEKIESIDYSDYEGATIVHDLNDPIPQAMHNGFDSVIDFGVTEHVFNIPVAFHSALSTLKVGGHYIAALPCNNAPGHGFYQFSPELFFSLMAPVNGMEIVRVLIHELAPGSEFKIVPDPRIIKQRVTFVNARETYVYILAKKVAPIPPSLEIQQSDYLLNWAGQAKTHESLAGIGLKPIVKLKQVILQLLPSSTILALNDVLKRKKSNSIAQFETYKFF